jgi:hypothetical protein
MLIKKIQVSIFLVLLGFFSNQVHSSAARKPAPESPVSESGVDKKIDQDRSKNYEQTYKVVVYNIENLFDADGIAIYDQYRPFDDKGNPQYTPAHLLTKLQNAWHTTTMVWGRIFWC